ncbi:DUF4097 family beta strand repeat-containing protein [Parafrankia sp. FMc6]|uniref:DUF4097 family beta strand repeat-containing protein n=1 Tax=Parafrankia soli TaxID=2599596 RepID=UPI0034D6F29B
MTSRWSGSTPTPAASRSRALPGASSTSRAVSPGRSPSRRCRPRSVTASSPSTPTAAGGSGTARRRSRSACRRASGWSPKRAPARSRRPTCSAATLRSGSGTVRVDGARAQLTMSTASGNLRAVGVTATEVDASTASGNVRIELATAPEDVSAHSASGNVRITVPDDGEVYATEVHTGSGNTLVGVRTDPLATRRLRASTSSGNAEIDYADPT